MNILASCSTLVAQSPANYGGESRPLLNIDAAVGWIGAMSQLTLSAGLTPGYRLPRKTSLIQGTVSARFGPGAGGPMRWRFSLLDVDFDGDPGYVFDWSPCDKSHPLEPRFEDPITPTFGLTLLDLNRLTAAENDTRWAQARVGLMERLRYQYGWGIDLRQHLAVGVATLRHGSQRYISLGEHADRTSTGLDARLGVAADVKIPPWNTYLHAVVDAELRALPSGFGDWRETLGVQLHFINRLGCSGNGVGVYIRAERQWTQLDEYEHRIDMVTVGMHVGLLGRRAGL